MSGPLKAAQVWFRRGELAAARASAVFICCLASLTLSTQPRDKNQYSFWLRLVHPLHPSFQAAGLWLLPAVLLVGLPLVALTGHYKGLTRYVGSRALYRLAGRNGLLVLLLAGLGVMLRLPMPPRSSWILLLSLRSVRPELSSPRLCAWLATTRSCPFSMTRRASGGARSTAS